MPSVRQQQLAARVTLRNDTAAPQTVAMHNQVLDGATVALDFPEQTLTLAAGASQEIEIAAPWANPHLWSHLDPFLYYLRTTLDNAGAADAVTNRFGFRELWTAGSNYIFNGAPIHLLGTATWPPASFLSSPQIQTLFAEVKAAHCVAMRLHTQPWDERFYDVADETGILLVEENAVWCDA
jgi:beta-galactosidase/beta-glucuronidase